VEEADLIVYCTGYKVNFPFFDPDCISAPDNDLPRFMYVFLPDMDNVFFIGFVQPWGSIMPIAEVQSKWVADYLHGSYALPLLGATQAVMQRDREALAKRYVHSKRHTMQIDVDDYLYDLAQEREAGAERARRHSGRTFECRSGTSSPRRQSQGGSP
ncbi:MAG: NAD(P)/FAD-dependent oxidoreductase, partial [Chloroflexota bacterium]